MIWLPPDLFTSQAPRHLKDRMPFVARGRTARNGSRTMALVRPAGGVGSGDASTSRASSIAPTAWPRPGYTRRAGRAPASRAIPICAPRSWTVTGSMPRLYTACWPPPRSSSDAEASAEMLRIYNDFIIDFSGHYPQRMIGLACLPFGDVRGGGERGTSRRQDGREGRRAWSCSWDMPADVASELESRCGQAINEMQLPLHFHTFPSVDPKLRAEVKGELLPWRCATAASACSR